jgi:hypothetical protein
MKDKEYWLKDGNNIHSVCQKAIYTYGAEHQQIKALEELGELSSAIARAIIGDDHNVEEEIADVEIMLVQLRLMFQGKDIDEMKLKKLERLAGHIW